MRALVLFFSIVIAVNPVLAKNNLEKLSPDQLERVSNNAAMDATVCMVFFKVTVDCLENTPGATSSETIEKYREARDTLSKLMVVLNSNAGMNEEGMKARVLDVSDEFQKKTGGHCANIAVLRREHLNSCIDMHNNPDSRISYWQNKLYP